VAGGAERVFSFVSQNMDGSTFSSQLLITGKENLTSYIVDKVPVTYLEKERVLYAIPRMVNFIKKEKPDIVFSSLTHLNTVTGLLSPLFPKTKFIIRPTNIGTLKQKGWIARLSSSWVDAVLCQSQDMAINFMEMYRTPIRKIVVIGNPITNTKEIKVRKSDKSSKKFITVGRLYPIKGHIRILNILAKLNTDFHYTIIGDGPEKDNIFKQVKELGLSTKVTHIPHTKKVNAFW